MSEISHGMSDSCLQSTLPGLQRWSCDGLQWFCGTNNIIRLTQALECQTSRYSSSSPVQEGAPLSCLSEGIQQKERDRHLVSQGCFTDLNISSYPTLPDGSVKSGISYLSSADNHPHGNLNVDGPAKAMECCLAAKILMKSQQERQRSICDRLQQIEIQSLSDLDAEDIGGEDGAASLPQCTASPLIKLTSGTPAVQVSGAPSSSPHSSCQRKTRPPPSSSPHQPTLSNLKESTSLESRNSALKGIECLPAPTIPPAKRTRTTPLDDMSRVVDPHPKGISPLSDGDPDNMSALILLQKLQQLQEQQLAALREHHEYLQNMYDMQERALMCYVRQMKTVSSEILASSQDQMMEPPGLETLSYDAAEVDQALLIGSWDHEIMGASDNMHDEESGIVNTTNLSSAEVV